MPIPTPRKDERKDKFLARCMEDTIMTDEYPDTDQRYAICSTQWRKKKK